MLHAPVLGNVFLLYVSDSLKTFDLKRIILYLISEFRPGILADVTSRIAEKGMSLEDVSTSIRLSTTGQREFVLDVLASSPNMNDKENLDQYVADLTAMEEDLQLSTIDIRVHTA